MEVRHRSKRSKGGLHIGFRVFLDQRWLRIFELCRGPALTNISRTRRLFAVGWRGSAQHCSPKAEGHGCKNSRPQSAWRRNIVSRSTFVQLLLPLALCCCAVNTQGFNMGAAGCRKRSSNENSSTACRSGVEQSSTGQQLHQQRQREGWYAVRRWPLQLHCRYCAVGSTRQVEKSYAWGEGVLDLKSMVSPPLCLVLL